MELIKNEKVTIFNEDKTLKAINPNLKKWTTLKKIWEKEQKKERKSKTTPLLAIDDSYDEQDKGITITNIHDIFNKEYGKSAAPLNITIRKALIAEMRTLNPRIMYEERLDNTTSQWSEMEKIVRRILDKPENKNEEEVQISIEDITRMFDVVKTKLGDERKYSDRIIPIIRGIQQAERFGQVSRKEMLFRDLLVNKYESLLFSAGFTRYIDENELVSLEQSINKTKKKSLDICFIENYTRNIPDNVGVKMMEAEQLEIFDNYAVMFYSDRTIDKPTNKNKRQIDPILFGVINGINRLYYIGDWIDGDDDLTWDVVEDNITDKQRIELNKDIDLNY